MKKYPHMIPLVVVIFLAVWILLSQEPQYETSKATMLQMEDIPDTYESILADATFYVKARFIEETAYLEGTSYQYTYELIEDYGENLRPQDGTYFHVYAMVSGLYKPGEVYYLFLQGTEAYMADTIMYTFVNDSFIAHYEDDIFAARVSINVEEPSAVATFENQVQQYAHSEAVEERTMNTFVSDEYLTLEDNVAAADAIWLITILDKQDMNPNSSLCSYRIEQVFRGNIETAPEGSVFNGLYPRAQVENGCSYYVLLKDVGNFEYQPFTFEHWLIGDGSEESMALLELIDTACVD